MEYFEELRQFAINGVLSEIQFEILRDRLNGKDYRDIIFDSRLSGNTAFEHCILKTVEKLNEPSSGWLKSFCTKLNIQKAALDSDF